jgi:hypothetical protein
MRSDATAHADRTALRTVRRLPRTCHLAQPSRGQRRCSGQPYRMQVTLGARRTAGRRQAADLAPGLPAEQVQPPPIKPHRNGRSALQATVPSGRLQERSRVSALYVPASAWGTTAALTLRTSARTRLVVARSAGAGRLTGSSGWERDLEARRDGRPYIGPPAPAALAVTRQHHASEPAPADLV